MAIHVRLPSAEISRNQVDEGAGAFAAGYFGRELMGLNATLSSPAWNTGAAEHLHKTSVPVRSIQWKTGFTPCRTRELNEPRHLPGYLTAGQRGTSRELKRPLSWMKDGA